MVTGSFSNRWQHKLRSDYNEKDAQCGEKFSATHNTDQTWGLSLGVVDTEIWHIRTLMVSACSGDSHQAGQGFIRPVSQLNFFCPVLPPSPSFHWCSFLINTLHLQNHLSLCFWGTQPVIPGQLPVHFCPVSMWPGAAHLPPSFPISLKFGVQVNGPVRSFFKKNFQLQEKLLPRIFYSGVFSFFRGNPIPIHRGQMQTRILF